MLVTVFLLILFSATFFRSKRETKKLIFKIGSQHKNVLIRKKSTKSTGKAQQTETKHISDITEKMAKIWNESGYRDIESTCTPKLAPLAQDDTKVAETNGEINEKFSNKTCARQAMHDYCDSSVTELAAYLDETLYIPKKMSFMAEMMYT